MSRDCEGSKSPVVIVVSKTGSLERIPFSTIDTEKEENIRKPNQVNHNFNLHVFLISSLIKPMQMLQILITIFLLT